MQYEQHVLVPMLRVGTRAFRRFPLVPMLRMGTRAFRRSASAVEPDSVPKPLWSPASSPNMRANGRGASGHIGSHAERGNQKKTAERGNQKKTAERGNQKKTAERGNQKKTVERGNQKKIAIFCVFVLCVPLTWTAGTASAGEKPLRFLQVLRENGYGDMAVDYLRILDKRSDLPQEVRDVWDLEMSKSLRAAADDAFDAHDYERLIAESQKHLAKFIREKPDHPAVASAIVSWGELLGQQAISRIGAAKSVAGKDKLQHEMYLADARENLELAQEKFIQTQQYLQKQLAALPPPPKLSTRRTQRSKAAKARAEIEANLLEARFQTAMADYYLAQTYSDPKNKNRIDTLHRAAKGFDDIFQQDRTSGDVLTLTGLRAHLWHGKTAEELGDPRLATDIYDEVLVNAAEPGQRRAATGLEPLFAQVEYFRMLILAKQKPDQFLAEAIAWLEQNRHRRRQTEGYQGIALAAAKAIHVKAQKAAGAGKAKGVSEALRIL
ncbi:MAG: hypothetical protein K8R46_13850, partial [Pirellulales bacterium]|nr:hypothetical protein [Pirellulales bacterium]